MSSKERERRKREVDRYARAVVKRASASFPVELGGRTFTVHRIEKDGAVLYEVARGRPGLDLRLYERGGWTWRRVIGAGRSRLNLHEVELIMET